MTATRHSYTQQPEIDRPENSSLRSAMSETALLEYREISVGGYDTGAELLVEKMDGEN